MRNDEVWGANNVAKVKCCCQGSYAVVTCEIKLFRNYFSFRRRPYEILLFQRVKTCLKLFQYYFTGLLQLVNIFQHVRCR